MVAISLLKFTICARKFAIFWLANAEVFAIIAFASAFAEQLAIRRFAVWTLTETSGVCPFLEMFPETVCVEMPPEIVPGFVLHCAATASMMIRACARTRTVLGFVCAAWSCTLPLAEYG